MTNQRKIMFKKNIACELDFQPNAQRVIYNTLQPNVSMTFLFWETKCSSTKFRQAEADHSASPNFAQRVRYSIQIFAPIPWSLKEHKPGHKTQEN